MRRVIAALVLALVTLSTFAQKKQKQELPDAVLTARYVYVTGWHGNELEFHSLPEERDAIFAVQSALKQWGRYHVVYHVGDADLMLVVKPGYFGMVQGGVNVGTGGMGTPPNGTGGTRVGTDVGGEVTNPDDFLLVSTAPTANAQDASYIWRHSQRHGLTVVQGKVPLFDEFRKAVDASDKARAARKNP